MSKNNDAKNEADAEDSPYESMVRSFTNRGKNKRKVKLVEDRLIQFAFGDSDSDDDEDFVLDDNRQVDSDHSDYVSDNDDDSNSDDDDDDDEAGSENDDSQDDITTKKSPSMLKLGDILDALKKDDKNMLNQTDDEVDTEEDTESAKEQEAFSGNVIPKRILVCGICLESESNEEDEIMECDNCGITVHEGCYGDIELPDSDDKSDSEAPTEPWFCEPCKAGLRESPICELCPNSGGIFKSTDTKKWVHLICALYTPFVGFRDISKLQTVVLEDIRSAMWGGKECMFCPDDNFSKTGVCITCDVGLCKSTFHVTCGQINGFLSDIPDKADDQDETSPDLLYAHCKLHSVKLQLQKRKRSWLSFQSHVHNFEKTDDPDEVKRIEDSLLRAKTEFKEYLNSVVPPKQPNQEYHRLLSSCPEACMMLAKKAEILGMLKHPGYNVAAAVTSGKIVKHEPNLSAEFANYFYKREMESKELTHVLQNTEPLLLRLQKEQKSLTNKSEEYQEQLGKVQSVKDSLIESFTVIQDALYKLSGKTFKIPFIVKTKQAIENNKLNESTKLLSTIVNRCATCKETSDQHLLAQCDTCKQYYHLACVDPPLTRMPKRSDKYLWQCTECDSSEESDVDTEESEVDGFRRNKKRTVNLPKKFTPEDESANIIVKTKKKRKRANNQRSINAKKKKLEIVKTDVVKKIKTIPNPKPKKQCPPPEELSDCCICRKSGNQESLVKCDECLNFYHFKTCLDPPYAKTPKSRYYGWICKECDESDEDKIIDEVDKENMNDVLVK